MIEHRSLFIDGRWVDPAGSDVIEVVSPHTEQPVGRVPHASSPDVDRAVESARRAFDSGEWPRLLPVDRAKTVTRLADAYESRLEDMAQLITLEMGSPISFSRLVQAGMPLGLLRYYSDLASEFAFEEERNGLMGKVLVVREPVGVVAAIAPMERAPVHCHAETRARAYRRVHRGLEALSGDPAGRLLAGRVGQGGRLAAGCAQHRAG